MKRQALSFYVSLLFIAGGLGAAYLSFSAWSFLPVLFGLLLFWGIAKYKPLFGLVSGALLMTVSLAGYGVLIGLSPILMTLVCTAGLACWNLLIDQERDKNGAQNTETGALERIHQSSLAWVSAASMLLALFSSLLDFRFPFLITILFVSLALGGLLYSVRYILKKN